MQLERMTAIWPAKIGKVYGDGVAGSHGGDQSGWGIFLRMALVETYTIFSITGYVQPVLIRAPQWA
jgi:hypothetical protein